MNELRYSVGSEPVGVATERVTQVVDQNGGRVGEVGLVAKPEEGERRAATSRSRPPLLDEVQTIKRRHGGGRFKQPAGAKGLEAAGQEQLRRLGEEVCVVG